MGSTDGIIKVARTTPSTTTNRTGGQQRRISETPATIHVHTRLDLGRFLWGDLLTAHIRWPFCGAFTQPSLSSTLPGGKPSSAGGKPCHDQPT